MKGPASGEPGCASAPGRTVSGSHLSVVVGVDGAGRSHSLREPATEATGADSGRTPAAAAPRQGRTARGADALLGTASPGPVLAVPALMATGRAAEAARAAAEPAASALRQLAEAALALGAPSRALPLFIEAAEAVELVQPPVVLPDTPHALGAVIAVAAGDPASAEYLLARALAAEVGGPVSTQRHRLLLAWVRLRGGRYDTAVAELRRLAGTPLPGRENLLASALAAGLARRSGNVAMMRRAWGSVEAVFARRAVDLFQLEQVEELAVAAARLRLATRVAPLLDALGETIDRLGCPQAWLVSLGWIHLQMAIASENGALAAKAAVSIADAAGAGAGTGEADGGGGCCGRTLAQAAAAICWADAVGGRVDPDAVVAAGDGLAEAGLPWEASRLVGQAAIRTGDPSIARRLLEQARDLGELTRGGGGDGRRRGARHRVRTRN